MSIRIKKVIVTILALVFIFGLFSCANNDETEIEEFIDESEIEETTDTTEDSGIDLSTLMPVAVFTMETGEMFEIELYKEVAPITVSNFVKLAKNGFYDGTIIHRITKSGSGISVIQGGGYFLDEDDAQYSKYADTIIGEFDDNGITNNLSHEEGVISMARYASSYDSASSQFFICYEDSSNIDGQYATFGRVRTDSDLEIVKEIGNSDIDGSYDGAPLDTIIVKTVTIKYVQC
jgi:peptidyl-prolyl cis-trans isomerase B (cyclophilin B)